MILEQLEQLELQVLQDQLERLELLVPRVQDPQGLLVLLGKQVLLDPQVLIQSFQVQQVPRERQERQELQELIQSFQVQQA